MGVFSKQNRVHIDEKSLAIIHICINVISLLFAAEVTLHTSQFALTTPSDSLRWWPILLIFENV